MHLDWWTVAMPIGLTILALLTTGPGMWSESWGWGVIDKKRRGKDEQAPRQRP